MENCKKRFAINIFLLLKITEILCKMFLIESRNFMKDTNKIKVCFVLLLIAVLVTLTGCGSQDLTKGEIAKYDYETLGISIDKNEIFVSDGAKCDTGNIIDILRKR